MKSPFITLGLLTLIVTPALAQDKKEPSVLFCSWNTKQYVDFDYYEELKKAGLRVDYLDSWSDFNAEKIRGYNTIVLFNFPAKGQQISAPNGGGAPGWNYEKTMAAVKDYLAQGGGVVFNVDSLRPFAPGEAPGVANMPSTQAALAEFGAGAAYEMFAPPPTRIVNNPRLGNRPYFLANDVQPSPVSEGVPGLWLPLIADGHGYLYSGPVVVDNNWTPVVRAGQDVGTIKQPFRSHITAAAGEKDLPGLLQREKSEPNPVVFAIREALGGRMAVFNLKSTFGVGAGTKWFYNRITLDRGLNNQPSGLDRLLKNTLRWTSEPSLKNGKLGGAKIPEGRLLPDSLQPETRQRFVTPVTIPADPQAPVTAKLKTFRGLVGVRSNLTGGTGTVEDYAKAAREAGLNFLIFLEDWSKLDEAKLKQLEADCARSSNENLLLVAGYSMPTNVGPRMFVYGTGLILPTDPALQSKNRPGTYALQNEDGKGGYESGTANLAFVFKTHLNGQDETTVGNIGFYDFAASSENGRFRPQHAKAFGAAGLLTYRDGKLIEDARPDYLTTNAGAMTCVPLAIAEINSPAQLLAHVRSGNALVQVEAKKATDVLREALRWNNQYDGLPVSVSEGPTISNWAGMTRTGSYGGEEFVSELARCAIELKATSEAGIREVRIYDGEKLFRRFLPGGTKEFSTRLYLSTQLQQNLSAEVWDTNGRKSITFPRMLKRESKPHVSFCGDHVNDCGGSHGIVKLARGSFWPGHYSPAHIDNSGYTWDGGPPPVVEILPFVNSSPNLEGDAVAQNAPYAQTPRLEFADERVFRGGSTADALQLSAGNAWGGWGPLAELPLADTKATFTLFNQAFAQVDPSAGGNTAQREGSASSLYEETSTFKRDVNLRSYRRGGTQSRSKSPNVGGQLIVGQGDKILNTLTLDTDKMPARDSILEIPQGGWFASISPGGANSILSFNRGEALRLTLNRTSDQIQLAIPKEGRQLKKGDQLKTDLFTVMWPMTNTITSSENLLSVIRYFNNPADLKLLQGKVLNSSGGLQELAAQNGVAEISIPRPTADQIPLPTDLAVRIEGYNPNWSAGEFQIEGPISGYYSHGKGIYRPVGIDPQGRIYAPILVSRGTIHTQLGHPVIAGPEGNELRIQVTALTSPRDGQPGSWHLSVNNPTDKPITTTLRRVIPLPGLKFTETKLTLQPGEYKILEQGPVSDVKLAIASTKFDAN